MDLAEFLAARLDDEEARVSGNSEWGDAHGDCYECGTNQARVLRQVTAIRAILEAWQAQSGYSLPDGVADGRDPDEAMRDEAVKDALEDVVRELAAIWSDHPDYQDAWKP